MTRRALHLIAGIGLLLLHPHPAAAQAPKAMDPAGEWEMTVETPAGNFTTTLKLARAGEQLSGSSVSQDGKETKLNDVKLAGNALTFTEDISYEGADYHLTYTGTIEGDAIKGTFETSGQTMTWSAKRSATPAAMAAGATGTWTVSVQTPNGTRERTLILKQEGGKLQGTITGPMDQVVALEDVSLQGKALRFTVTFNRNGTTMKRTFAATVEGDSLSGKVEGNDPQITFTGKRAAAPAAPTSTVAAPLAGAWKLAVQAPDRTYRPTVTLAEQEGKWSGKLVDEQGDESMLKDIVVKGNLIDFAADLETGGMTIHLKFSGTLDGDKLKGTMIANDNSLPTSGDRQKGG